MRCSVSLPSSTALQVVDNHRRSHLRIVAEGTSTDDDVLGVGVHVGHGGEVDVEAVFLQVSADGIAAVVGILWVARGTDGTHRLELLHLEVLIVADTGHAASFLVDAEQRRAHIVYSVSYIKILP